VSQHKDYLEARTHILLLQAQLIWGHSEPQQLTDQSRTPLLL
jgi:hypothetical protein